jgi:hypothetical protein
VLERVGVEIALIERRVLAGVVRELDDLELDPSFTTSFFTSSAISACGPFSTPSLMTSAAAAGRAASPEIASTAAARCGCDASSGCLLRGLWMSRDWFGLFLNDGRASSQADLPATTVGADHRVAGSEPAAG